MLKKVKQVRTSGPEYLPAHIGQAFEKQLETLIETLQDGSFRNSYLKSEYKSKYLDNDKVPASQRSSAAIQKWMAAEGRNELTNSRLLIGEECFGWTTSDAIVSKARRLIRELLPDVRTLDLSRGSMTNGASTRVRRSEIAAILKHVGTAHVTASAYNHWAFSTDLTVLEDIPVEVVDGSVLFTVPKKTDIDRVACKEPEINMFMQRVVGDSIRQRLKRVGIDLDDQTINQRLSERALKDGLATIDLSSASDTISHQLVFELLPFEWFSLMDDLRSHQVLLPDGTSHPLSMFSSMGNGFTFELESLIFWALTRAVAWQSGIKGRISVYGDDIICPSVMARRLQRVFYYFGFTVNSKKSAWSGLFRESCGKHYHNSSDVTPFYLREPVTRVSHVIRILNRLLMWSSFKDFHMFTHEEISEFHNKWSKQIPRNLRGGNDPEQSDSLVTPERPHSHFVRKVSKKVQVDQSAALAFWFTTRVEREVVHNNVIDLPTCISIPREYFSWGFTDAVCVPCSTYKAMLMWQKDFFPSLYEPSLYDPKVDKGPALAPVSVRSNRTSWF